MTAYRFVEVTKSLLKKCPLPAEDPHGDKEDRGHVLVVAGSREMPGAAILAATAALRAGAGKLTIATAQSAAIAVAAAMPEARVLGLPETAKGGFTKAGVMLLEQCTKQAASILIGPGMIDPKGSLPFVSRLLERVSPRPVILDALAMEVLKSARLGGQNLLITPHAGEMCNLSGRTKEEVQESAATIAFEYAQTQGIRVALKGPISHIATQGQDLVWRHHSQLPGLGTSGSGDVLAGIITGFSARGLLLEQAAFWGVAVHARAGKQLGMSKTGYLARELLDHIPHAWHTL